MGQILRPENLSSLVIDSVTTISLPPSVLTIGGQQFSNESDLAMDITTGGLDTGSVATDTLYNVYAVNNSGAEVLVSSLSHSAPTGFSIYKKVGYLLTNGSSDIISVVTLSEDGNTSNWSTPITTTITGTSTDPTKGTIVTDEIIFKKHFNIMEVVNKFHQSGGGTGGSGTYLFEVPFKFQIDPSKIEIDPEGTAKGKCGSWASSQSPAGSMAEGYVKAYNSTNLAALAGSDVQSTQFIDSGFKSMTVAGTRYYYNASIPILEWA